MSVHEKTTNAGTKRYVVRWREAGRNRSRAFTRKRDAETYDAEIQRRQQLGAIAVAVLDAGKQTLDEFVTDTWGPAHLPTVTPRTRGHYVRAYDLHVSPFLGSMALRDIRPSTIAAWQSERVAAGAGIRAIQQAATLLGAILRAAVADELIASNPATAVKKLKAPAKRTVTPLSPAQVEAIRTVILEGGTDKRGRRIKFSRDPQRDAALVAVLAYSGVRPGEALALRWRDVGSSTLAVERAVALGVEQGTKTGRTRRVRLLDPLRRDLAEYRLACGRPADDALVFPNPDGMPWGHDDWANWRTRTYQRAARLAGVGDTHPYALRHSFVSLLLHEGENPVVIAEELGHSPEMTLRTYGHTMRDLRGTPRTSAEAAIRAVRGESVPSQFPRAV